MRGVGAGAAVRRKEERRVGHALLLRHGGRVAKGGGREESCRVGRRWLCDCAGNCLATVHVRQKSSLLQVDVSGGGSEMVILLRVRLGLQLGMMLTRTMKRRLLLLLLLLLLLRLLMISVLLLEIPLLLVLLLLELLLLLPSPSCLCLQRHGRRPFGAQCCIALPSAGVMRLGAGPVLKGCVEGHGLGQGGATLAVSRNRERRRGAVADVAVASNGRRLVRCPR